MISPVSSRSYGWCAPPTVLFRPMCCPRRSQRCHCCLHLFPVRIDGRVHLTQWHDRRGQFIAESGCCDERQRVAVTSAGSVS